jgi:hypothetical protein
MDVGVETDNIDTIESNKYMGKDEEKGTYKDKDKDRGKKNTKLMGVNWYMTLEEPEEGFDMRRLLFNSSKRFKFAIWLQRRKGCEECKECEECGERERSEESGKNTEQGRTRNREDQSKKGVERIFGRLEDTWRHIRMLQ